MKTHCPHFTLLYYIILISSNQEDKFLSKSLCDTHLIEETLKQNYEITWKRIISNKTKLRTYTIFKKDFHTEHYLKLNLAKWERSTLAQFRLGVLPLEIETGRFKSNKQSPTKRTSDRRMLVLI